jgi:hypothetical protein
VACCARAARRACQQGIRGAAERSIHATRGILADLINRIKVRPIAAFTSLRASAEEEKERG